MSFTIQEVLMSHHLDTPLARQNGQLYIDDLCVFPGNGSTVFVMDVNSTITESNVQPGFHHEGRYEFKVHFDGAPYEDLTYRVSFGAKEADGTQTLQLHALSGEDARDDFAAGELLLEGRTGAVVESGDVRIWAGKIIDWFYIDLSLLFKINAAVKEGMAPDLSDWRAEQAQNSFAGTTVESIVLEVSHQNAKLRPGAQIGVWAATKLATDAAGWRQINRAGHPMMWPIFWPDDIKFDNPANTRHPSEDSASVGQSIGEQVAEVVAACGTSADPHGYGEGVARRLFPDVLPYAVGTPASYGFAGFNGRTLADNAPEAMLSLVLNTGVSSGLTPGVARTLRDEGFPYVVP
ncbi:MAG: DUF4331 family protein, partial [Solirubrobacteraceae bacterium]